MDRGTRSGPSVDAGPRETRMRIRQSLFASAGARAPAWRRRRLLVAAPAALAGATAVAVAIG
jgi:hypothetical protein